MPDIEAIKILGNGRFHWAARDGKWKAASSIRLVNLSTCQPYVEYLVRYGVVWHFLIRSLRDDYVHYGIRSSQKTRTIDIITSLHSLLTSIFFLI